MVASPTGLVDGVLDAIGGVLEEISATITGFIDERLDTAGTFLSTTIDSLGDRIDLALGVAGSTLDTVITKATDSIDAVLDAQVGVISSIRDKVVQIPDAIEDGIDDILDALHTKVVQPIDNAIDAAQEKVEEVVTKLGGLLTVVLETISTQLSSALEPLKDLASDLGTGVNTALTGFVPSLLEFLAPEAVKRVTGLVSEFESTPDIPESIKALTAPGALPILAGGAIVGSILLFAAIQQVATAGMQPWMLNLTANVNRSAQPMRLPVGDSIRAQRRGFWGIARTAEELSEVGYSPERQFILQQLDTEQLQVQEVLNLWLRGLIESPELDIRLAKLGFRAPDIQSLRTLAFPIPSVQDLIQMAVREVFSPEIAEQFGQFDEIPEEYTTWTRRQGLSEFWSRNIWAAHWVLPSIQMGFEMLHRGKINEKELGDLFVAQDVMPFWRDKLAAISFKLITRVDIRRMHAVDVLSDQEVFDSYIELGYNDDKAQKLTDLVLKITAARRAPKSDRERDLTRADIIGLFDSRLIGKPEALQALGEIGFDENESGLLIARAEIKMIVSERRSRKELIFDRFRVGTLTFEQAQDSLVELSLTSIELDQAITDLLLLRERRLTLPTKADFDRFLTKDLIKAAEYEDGMRLLGYAEHWIALYLQLLDGQPELVDGEADEQ